MDRIHLFIRIYALDTIGVDRLCKKNSTLSYAHLGSDQKNLLAYGELVRLIRILDLRNSSCRPSLPVMRDSVRTSTPRR